MSLGKQSKIVTDKQTEAMLAYLTRRRNGIRNRAVFLLSVKAGLRSKEIACLRWSMLVNPDGQLADAIHLTDDASKGQSGRVIPLNRNLKDALQGLYDRQRNAPGFDLASWFVVRSERSNRTSPQAVVNMFFRWYRDLGYVGCSSHSGRRTFITNAARRIGSVGGSLRDIQLMAGHRNLQTTQRYIEHDTECQRKVVNLV
ncbi:MAG: site-specific integrase [Candidatus Didemnitutus sp.]|nr:site-specific integrase [Candidatus Didemnitutus sp.]